MIFVLKWANIMFIITHKYILIGISYFENGFLNLQGVSEVPISKIHIKKLQIALFGIWFALYDLSKRRYFMLNFNNI